MKFKPIYAECITEEITWEECNERYCCDVGEECWFASEDYYNDCGKGSVKK